MGGGKTLHFNITTKYWKLQVSKGGAPAPQTRPQHLLGRGRATRTIITSMLFCNEFVTTNKQAEERKTTSTLIRGRSHTKRKIIFISLVCALNVATSTEKQYSLEPKRAECMYMNGG